MNACGATSGGSQDAAHLFQPLHVFEVESNIKKAEIRIYKLKLQDKKCQMSQRKALRKTSFDVTTSHSLEPF